MMTKMAKEVSVPDELNILLPEQSKGTIVVGDKAYEIFPLVEGQLERITADLVSVMEKINSPDGQCPKCGKVIKSALPKKIFNCPDCGDGLMTMDQSPVEAIVSSGKVPIWVEMITGVPKEEVAGNMTLNQIKHFAGLFWKLNFSDEGLPEVSQQNFKNLLEMMSPKKGTPPPAEKKEESPLQQ
jgi:predicted RNA-binding Zn-ribbon protein involved in translation (DUF1610 family)